MTRSLLVVSAGLSEPSSTRLLADRLRAATLAALEGYAAPAHAETVELRPLAHEITDALMTGFGSGDLARVHEAVRGADAVIAVTPVFSASYSGLFKSFVDGLEPGSLEGTPVLLGATAGTARHSLVIDHALRPLFAYLRAVPVPTGVFAASEDWGGDGGPSGTLAERIERAGAQLAALVAGAAPARTRPDGFADVVDFETLLRRS